MKKKFPNQGFQFVFSLGIIVSLLLPSVLVAQYPHKQHKANIPNHNNRLFKRHR
ncbi:hypothetical protein BDD43_0772 [Mucilaginibacter gracilis]|uniref:Uncharacterized protein n=1 Tax=Mucilaginibacter gracilis TaxID=423350 RepID=A0A495IV61_9SPHI|nr:hypothetical protein BDD43_0772 [Mucilaginibacter gracilis]